MRNERPVRIGALVGASLALASLGLLAGCSVGGAGEDPDPGESNEVGFSFGSSATTLLENGGPASVQVVLHATLPLETDVSVAVTDAGTGTATSAADYAAFPSQTITFPAGALDGAFQTVALDPRDDALVEGASETVDLVLQDPVGGTLVGQTQFTATLTDIHAARLGFATAGNATNDEASRLQPVAVELDCGAGVTLGVAVSVRVSDMGTGSASSPADYSSFAAQTVSFAAGAADGAVKTVNVQVVDDTGIEGDETVVLGLSAPSVATLGTNIAHTLTIKDDDLAGGATLVASEGPSGTENPLTYGEVVPLGSQRVGAGPNAGTLLRVANGGSTPMELGAPGLGGTDLIDFAVEVESAFLPAGFTGQLVPVASRSPLAQVPDAGPGHGLRLDSQAIASMGALESVALDGFALPNLGAVTLELERRPLPITADAKLVIDGQEIAGGVGALVGGLQIWRGGVAGMPGSRVFLALTDDGAQGFIELPEAADRLVHILPDGPGRVRLLGELELAALGLEPPPEACAGQLFVPDQPFVQELDDGTSTSALTVAGCRLALETDFQLFQKFNSSTLLTNYVTALVGVISDQYFTDVQTTLSIAYLGIHTTANDGWTTQENPGGVATDLLREFQSAWGTSWPAQADLAHFLSGDTLGGGVAYVGSLCNPSYGFGVSANLTGGIDWSTWTGQAGSFTWDFVVVAHELGHNFGSFHTQDYCPPLDRCYPTPLGCVPFAVCSHGTLMSYCHTCPGGLDNMELYFHPLTANIMRAKVNTSCLAPAAVLPGGYLQYRVRFNPLTAAGARSATLEFTHDATNVSQPFQIRLAGTAH